MILISNLCLTILFFLKKKVFQESNYEKLSLQFFSKLFKIEHAELEWSIVIECEWGGR